jgi:hypothetical protein
VFRRLDEWRLRYARSVRHPCRSICPSRRHRITESRTGEQAHQRDEPNRSVALRVVLPEGVLRHAATADEWSKDTNRVSDALAPISRPRAARRKRTTTNYEHRDATPRAAQSKRDVRVCQESEESGVNDRAMSNESRNGSFVRVMSGESGLLLGSLSENH